MVHGVALRPPLWCVEVPRRPPCGGYSMVQYRLAELSRVYYSIV